MIKLSNIWGFSCWKKIISNNFLQQWCTSQNIYCQEAVDSVTVVESCPTSKEEWDSAAFKKNCIRIAARQNCINAREKFQYHCVINGLRNELLEVCAPTRIIFGKLLIIIFMFIRRLFNSHFYPKNMNLYCLFAL